MTASEAPPPHEGIPSPPPAPIRDATSAAATGSGAAIPAPRAPLARPPAHWPQADAREASPPIRALAADVAALVTAGLPEMGLTAGLRPAADVDALLSTVASVEYELARRMHAASAAGALPLVGEGALPMARHWSGTWARRLARAGAFADRHPAIASPWAAGIITSDHVDALARRASELAEPEMAALIESLADRWGRITPEALARFVQRVVRLLHPPPDPEPDELSAYAARNLSFSVLGDQVILAGNLPRLEGEAVMVAVEAWAERLRSAADHVPAGARRADGLVALVNAAATADQLPNRGGLPVALSVTLSHTSVGDPTWVTSRGHLLTGAEQRFTACAADVTPVVVAAADSCTRPEPGRQSATTATRIAALATTLLDEQTPLAVGRTRRHATPAQRKALAVRDRGCAMPGCTIPAEACQAHHLTEWSAGGLTDLDGLVLLCWSHHRQVDLGTYRIEPAGAGAAPPTDRAWPGNNGSPWTVVANPRSRWRT